MQELYTVYGPKTTLEMSWREAEQILSKSDVAIIIVGATEQHGPHNPMGVDTFIPLETAKRALRILEKEGITALISTPVPFGMSHHHLHYPGTIALRPETLIELLYDIGQCLADQGVNKIIFMIGHTSAEQEACCHIAGLRLQQKFGMAYALFNRVKVRQRFTEEDKAKFANARRSKIFDSHGGERETSCMLAIAPRLVIKEWLEGGWSEEADRIYKEGLLFGEAVRKGAHPLKRSGLLVPYPAPQDYTYKGLGQTGDPTVATEEYGNIVLDLEAKYLADMIRNLVKMK